MGHRQNQWGNQKIPEDKWIWKHNDTKYMGHSKSCSMREVYNNTDILGNKKDLR